FLEIVSTDYKPVAEIVFAKPKNKDAKENQIVNLEEFITVKGINALGNQLTKDKVKQVNLLEPLPFEEPQELPAEEMEVVEEETLSENTETNPSEGLLAPPQDLPDTDTAPDENGQTTLF